MPGSRGLILIPEPLSSLTPGLVLMDVGCVEEEMDGLGEEKHASLQRRNPSSKSAPGKKPATSCIMALESVLPFISQGRNIIRKGGEGERKVLGLSENLVSAPPLPPGAILSRSPSRSSRSQVGYCSFPMC